MNHGCLVYIIRKNRQGSQRSLISEASTANTNTSSTVGNNTKNQEVSTSDDDVVLRPERCFSLIFRGDWTLDLLLANDETINRDELLNALDRIIKSYQELKTKVSNDVLLLRYVWLEADKVRFVVYCIVIGM
jgi:hypothetical protein